MTAIAKPVQARVVDAEHPWLGLSPFTEATKSFFFGRDGEIRDIFLRVREHPLTVLYGQSGLGKTSLLGAGLIPKLRVEGFHPVLLRFRYEASDSPLVEQAIAAVWTPRAESDRSAINPTRSASRQTLWELFHHLPSRVATLESTPLVLIFDQFEEIFTLPDAKRRDAELLEARAVQREQSHGPTDEQTVSLRQQASAADAQAKRVKADVEEFFRQLADLIENRPPSIVGDLLLANRRLAREYDLGPSPVRVVLTLVR